MRHFSFMLLFFTSHLFFSAAISAQSTGPHNWQKIADLPPGTPLEVHEPFARYSTDCTLVWIDNNALACETFDLRGAPQRVIYRRAEIESVQRVKVDSGNEAHAMPILVGMCVGSLLGGLMARDTTPGVIALGVTAGLAIGGGIPAGAFAGMGVPHPQPQFSVRIPFGRQTNPYFR